MIFLFDVIDKVIQIIFYLSYNRLYSIQYPWVVYPEIFFGKLTKQLSFLFFYPFLIIIKIILFNNLFLSSYKTQLV
jgi:hypothetical protein